MLTSEEVEIQRRWEAAVSANHLESAFAEAQRLLQSIRQRGDRAEEHRAMERFASLLRRAGEPGRADRIAEYLRRGYERGERPPR
jgi:hypothetical protein